MIRLPNFLLILLVGSVSFSSLAQNSEIKEVFRSHSEFLDLNSSVHFIGTDTMAFIGFSRYEDLGPFWFSTDQGASWKCKGYEPLTRLPIREASLLVLDLRTVLMNNQNDELIISRDSGATFSLVSLPFEERVDRITKVGPNIIVGFWNEYYITTDTCKTFAKVDLPLGIGRVLYRKGDYAIMVNDFPSTKGYMETFDAGLTWNMRSYWFKTANQHQYIDDSTVYTFNAAEKKLRWSNDRLRTLDTQIVLDFDSSAYINAIGFSTRYIGYLVTNDTMMYKTYDGGITWRHKHTFKVRVNTVEALSDKTVVFHNMRYLSENAVIYVSNNAGENLSIIEKPAKKGIKVYPNPAHNRVTVELEGFENGQLSIYNLEGQKVHSDAFTSGMTLSTDKMQNGLYLIQVSDALHSERTLLTVVK